MRGKHEVRQTDADRLNEPSVMIYGCGPAVAILGSLFNEGIDPYGKTWGQTGRTPIISSRSGKHKSNPDPLLCSERIIPVSFFLWLDYRVL